MGTRKNIALFIFVSLAQVTRSSITGSSSVSSVRIFQVSTIERNLERPEEDLNDPGSQLPNQILSETDSGQNLNGFNLLWLISARIHHQNSSRGRTPHRSSSSSRRLSNHGVHLHSKLPKRILRYHRPANYINPLRVSKRTKEKHVGFETEFRLRNTSGSGYLIIGRSLERRATGDGARRFVFRRSPESASSWFGLYSKVAKKTFSLRLEYRNSGWCTRQKFSTPLEGENFELNHWHNLSVQIDYDRNRIDYWVNCTRMNAIQIEETREDSTSHINVYRLLQHKTKSKFPVQVTFKSMIITDGTTRDQPKQCINVTHTSSIPVCSGGKIFMECGPSCEQTCTSRHLPLERCAASCTRGCHCPPHEVLHRGVCIETDLCPCRIGSMEYPPEMTMTINNEMCTCTSARWSCYAAASFTQTPQNQTVSVGGSFNLTCGVGGNPLPEIRWEIPDDVDATIDYRPGSRRSQLFVSNATLSVDGNYVCHAQRDSDGWAETAAAHIEMTSPPVITSLAKTMTVTHGNPIATIDCHVRGKPTPRAAWFKNGSRLRSYSVASGVLRLKISHVNATHAGKYRCWAKNKAGTAFESVMVIVKLPAPSSMAFRRQPRDRCIKEGHTAVFPCQVIDHGPQVNVTWFKNGQTLDSRDRRIVKKRNRLVIRRATREDAGTYSCHVSMTTSDTMQAKAKLMIKGRMLPWSNWSPCTASCGGGWKYKRRKCTGVPPNEKTCHGKFSVMKRCNAFACPGVCSSYGDPHYTTFDGRQFNFQGDCSYVLSQDVAGNTFKIIQYNVACGSRLSCVRKVSVVLALPGLSAVVDLGRDQTVLLNGVPLALPFHAHNANFSIVQTSGCAYIGVYVAADRMGTPRRCDLLLGLGSAGNYQHSLDNVEDITQFIIYTRPKKNKMTILWRLFYVVVAGKYQGRTQGLCGNFNGDPSDDNLSPQGRTLGSDLEFGQSWAAKDGNANFSCSAVSTLNRICGRSPVVARQAKATCIYLTDKTRFGKCHNVVSVGTFITSCMLDICSTSLEKTNMYFCIALSAYAEECLREGVELNWRTPDICPISCSGGMLYSECGPNCIRYCPSKVRGGKVCLSQRKCVAGCYCPENKVFHNGVCIPVSACPCKFNGMVFANGSRHERNCRQCICKGGGWHCVFNKRLCEFPASVVKDPQSQVVTMGRTVSFCCGVTGIPAPSVEWYRNGERLNDTSQRNRSWKRDKLNATLVLPRVASKDLGSYSCKAINVHGSHHSGSASLKYFDPEMHSCNAIPKVNRVSLPDGCYVTVDDEKQYYVNLGRCSGDPCYGSTGTITLPVSSCNPNRLCCQASTTSPVMVKCRHHSYVTSFLITVVRECSCVVCSERTTVVEGVVKNTHNDEPIPYMKLSHQGRTVGYSSSTGSFRISFPNLPLETRHVTIILTDVMLRRYTTTVKNLVVLPGESTLHTIHMRPFHITEVFDSREGFQHVFKVSDGYSHRMKLIIPPNSLVHDRHSGPHVGVVKVGITLIDHNSPTQSQLNGYRSEPGNPIAIGLMGDELLLSPSVTLSISLSNDDSSKGRVDLRPGKFVVFNLITNGMGMKLQSWALDDLTGLWREDRESLSVEPKYTKNGETGLSASAKIRRLSTAWSLGIGEIPCYLRAKVIDALNNPVPGVKISFTAAQLDSLDEERPLMSSKRSKRNNKPLFSSKVEALTGSRSYPNGACLPVGCHNTGMLQASRLGNELVLLEPNVPDSNMGRVKEMNLMTESLNVFENVSNISSRMDSLDISRVHNSTNMTSHYAYFRTRDECRDTSPSLQTYVFRDNAEIHDGRVLSRYRYHFRNNVILTFGMPNQRPSTPKPVLKYCHVKVQVQYYPSFIYTEPIQLEVTTLRNRSARNSLLVLGWRTNTLKAPSSVSLRGVATEHACIEYLCGETHLTDKEQLILRVTIRDKIPRNATQTQETSGCRFLPYDYYTIRTNNHINEPEPPDESNRSGYIYVQKMFNIRLRSFRTPTQREITNEFSAASLAESKEKCENSLPNDNISAYFECL